MSPSPIIGIRVSQHEKQNLEKLASMMGISLSELIRRYVVAFAKIGAQIENIETVEDMSRAMAKLIISSPDVQEVLDKVYRYMASKTDGLYCIGNIHTCNAVPVTGDYYLVKWGDRYDVIKARNCEDVGDKYCVITEYEQLDINDIADMLGSLEYMLDAELEHVLKKMRESIRKIMGK